MLVDDDLARSIDELDIAALLNTGQPVGEYPGMVVLWLDGNLARILVEIATLLAVTETDE